LTLGGWSRIVPEEKEALMINTDRVAVISEHYDQFALRDAESPHWLDSFTYGVLTNMTGACAILEIGCGNGRAIPVFEQFRDRSTNHARNLTYTGIDCSKKSLDVARKLYHGYSFIEGDGFRVSEYFPEQRFDMVWLGAVLMIYSPKEARLLLQEVRKVLTNEAVGFVSVPYGEGTYHPPTLPENVQYHRYNADAMEYILGDLYEPIEARVSGGMLLVTFRVK